MRALLDPGDEFLVTDPSYVSYAPCVEMAHARAVTVRTHLEHEFRIQPGPLADACTDSTRGLLFCNPSNPTGAVMRRSHLEGIAEVAAEKDLLVISDEIYAELTYEGDHCSFPSLDGMYDRTLLLNGFSKADAMTGWRVGYACGPADIIEAMTRMHAYTTMCVPIMGQLAAIEALRRGADDRARMVAEYDQRRRVFVNGLNRIGLQCFEPMGAFYAFPSIASTGLSSQGFARALLEDQAVAVVPGDAFGDAGEGHVRCSYASSISDLREALARIEKFLGRLESGEVVPEQ
jgi:aminotransferase